jgi:hypothetical protein
MSYSGYSNFAREIGQIPLYKSIQCHGEPCLLTKNCTTVPESYLRTGYGLN